MSVLPDLQRIYYFKEMSIILYSYLYLKIFVNELRSKISLKIWKMNSVPIVRRIFMLNSMLSCKFPKWSFFSFQFMKFVKKLRDGEYTIENNQAC